MSTLPLDIAPELASTHDVELVLSVKIGAGHDRDVWRHPLDDTLCVKVAQPNHGRAQNDIDLHYGAHLQRRNISSPHVPRVYGMVPTDRGPGLVVDLVRQPDGTTCPTLPQALRSGMVGEAQAEAMVHEACEWLARNGVMLADPGIHNVMVRGSPATGRPCLVFVDGLGTRNLDLKYWARCAFEPLERMTARQKAAVFRDKFLRLLRDRSSKLWVPKRPSGVAQQVV
ncbi:YrbL family protein [Bordetella bronchialis]|uniref:PhoP regulatory network protein YrbL n=1 Tax=Bordetella bronchialis TaxID=463025 RepID=A0A193FU53_9BORD|nr:YrbL family protein [Bordetella bronchialis]ANN70711.1 hypothetical protein BAU08_04645 [Bordetella bronchialis]